MWLIGAFVNHIVRRVVVITNLEFRSSGTILWKDLRRCLTINGLSYDYDVLVLWVLF